MELEEVNVDMMDKSHQPVPSPSSKTSGNQRILQTLKQQRS